MFPGPFIGGGHGDLKGFSPDCSGCSGAPWSWSPGLSRCPRPTSVIAPSDSVCPCPSASPFSQAGLACMARSCAKLPQRGGWAAWASCRLSTHIVGVDKGNGFLVSRCDPAGHIHQARLSPCFFFPLSHFRFGLRRGNSNCERTTCQDKNRSS